MQWRHLQPLRRKRSLAAAAVNMLVPSSKKTKQGGLIVRMIDNNDKKNNEEQPQQQASSCVIQVDMIQSLAHLLRRCDCPQDLPHGRRIHEQVIASGQHYNSRKNSLLGLLLVQMYSRCGSLGDAKAVLNEWEWCSDRLILAWNSILAAYLEHGQEAEVLRMYKEEMVSMKVVPNEQTYIRLLVACSRLRALSEGKAIHSKLISAGFQNSVVICTTLIHMYGRCGCLRDAWKVFNMMEMDMEMENNDNSIDKEEIPRRTGTATTGKRRRTAATWNVMISCYAQCGHVNEAILTYRRMNCEGITADVFTLSILLGCCSSINLGSHIHARAAASGLDSHPVVGSALVRMYGRLGFLQQAAVAFHSIRAEDKDKDVVCWTALLAACVDCGEYKRALSVYREAVLSHNLEPDAFTLSTVLCACCSDGDVEVGREIHRLVLLKHYHTDSVVGTAVVNMYGRCGRPDDAKRAFDDIKSPTAVSWNALLSAYATAGAHWRVVEEFEQGCVRMIELNIVEPDALIFSKLLAACASIGDIGVGIRVHNHIRSLGLEGDSTLQNGLISMYSRCGSLANAKATFDSVISSNNNNSNNSDAAATAVCCWNAIISATSHYNQVELSIDLFRCMQLDGVQPNQVTLTSILHACAHAGLVTYGGEYFRDNISPANRIPDHYHCVIDLLGRLGMVAQAEDLICNMPFEPDLVAWTTLVGACRMHGEAECAARCAQHLSNLSPLISGPYMLLSSICTPLSDADADAEDDANWLLL